MLDTDSTGHCAPQRRHLLSRPTDVQLICCAARAHGPTMSLLVRFRPRLLATMIVLLLSYTAHKLKVATQVGCLAALTQGDLLGPRCRSVFNGAGEAAVTRRYH